MSKRYLDDFDVTTKPYHQCDDGDESLKQLDEIDLIKKQIKFQQFQTPNPKRYNDDFNIVTKPYADHFREDMGAPPSRDMMYGRHQAPEIERLEKMLSEIKEKKVDKDFSKDKFTQVLIDNLYSQITFLKQDPNLTIEKDRGGGGRAKPLRVPRTGKILYFGISNRAPST